MGYFLGPLEEQTSQAIGRLILQGAVLMSLAVVMAFFVARYLVRPIERLTSSIQAIAAGNLGARVEVPETAELRQLAQAFNAMGRKLQARIRELQEGQGILLSGEEDLRKEAANLLQGRVESRLLLATRQLEQGEAFLRTDPARAATVLAGVRHQLESVREDGVRLVGQVLHPSAVSVGLLAAVRSLLQSFEERFRVTLTVDPVLEGLDTPGANGVPEGARLVIYRVLEEALANSWHHGQATEVTVSLSAPVLLLARTGRHLQMEVHDNGAGFDTSSVPRGWGLSSIEARVGRVGGAWEIDSRPNDGTRLSVAIPLRGAEEAGV